MNFVKIFEVNVKSAAMIAKEAYPHLKKTRFSIVITLTVLLLGYLVEILYLSLPLVDMNHSVSVKLYMLAPWNISSFSFLVPIPSVRLLSLVLQRF